MAIKAGDIIWTIGAKTGALDKALKKSATKAQAMAQKFGGASRAIGVGFTVAGAAITASLTKSIMHFVKTGDAVQKMAIRTGASTEAISELGFAAEQSGSSMEAIGKAFKAQANFMEDANDGLSTSTLALDKLGLSVEMLKGQTPEQVFMTLSSAIASIEDPMQRAALANDVFARSGTELLPLFASGAAGIANLRAEAEALGISLSQEQADSAAQFGDSLNSLKKSLGAVGLQIGEALVPVLNDLMPKVTEMVTTIIDWMKANKPLVEKILLVVGAVGGMMTVLGPLLVILPGLILAFKGIAAIAGVVASAFGLLFSPIGLLVAAVAGLAYVIVSNWDWIKSKTSEVFSAIGGIIGNAARFWMDKLQPVWNFISNILGGIAELLGFSSGGVIPGLVAGGIVPALAAGGVTPSRVVRVGERGPELLSAPIGSRVLSHSDMMRAASTDFGGGGSRSINDPVININIEGALDADEIVSKIQAPLLDVFNNKLQAAMS
jgi:hypothetical protein